MRRFALYRTVDITGISGTGIILCGVEWVKDGPVDVYWPKTETTGQYPSLKRLREIHCYPVEGKPNATIGFFDRSHEFHGPLVEEEEQDGGHTEGHGQSESEDNHVW